MNSYGSVSMKHPKYKVDLPQFITEITTVDQQPTHQSVIRAGSKSSKSHK